MRKSTRRQMGGVFDKAVRIAACLALTTMSVPAMSIAAFADETGGESGTEASAAVAVSDEVSKAALKSGSTLELKTETADKLSVGTDGDLSFAQIGVGGAISTTVNVESEGWLIFDWKMIQGTSGGWNDKFSVSVDSGSSSTIAPNSSTHRSWATKVISVAAGEHVLEWSYPSSSSNESHADTFGCIDNVRFVTAKTAVSATADNNTTVKITSGSSEVTEVAPESKVTFEAAVAEGYVFSGWKKTKEDTEYVSKSPTYETTVYDEPVSLYAESSKLWEGIGVEENPFQISSLDDLKTLDECVNGGITFAGQYFVLNNDITVDDTFKGIGSEGKGAFCGVFDGNEKTISNVIASKGLFVALGSKDSTATVKDLSLAVNIEANQQDVGGLAGIAYANIEDCSAHGAIVSNFKNTGSTQRLEVGGIVGKLAAGSIARSFSDVVITANEFKSNAYGGVGGVAGMNSGSITQCDYTGELKANSTAGVGGIAGVTDYASVISECYASGTITGSNRVGGLVGEFCGNLSDSGFQGDVSSSEDMYSYAGGVIGYCSNTSSMYIVSSCYASGSVSASISSAASNASVAAGGIAGYLYAGGSVVQDCIALQKSIQANSANVGRVVGLSVEYKWGSVPAPRLSNNYGYTGMSVGGVTVAASDAAANNTQGANANATVLLNEEAVPSFLSGWSANTWNIAAGKLPTLKNVAADDEAAYPSYIKPIDFAEATVEIEDPNYDMGKAITPSIEVRADEAVLPESSYQVAYKDAAGNDVTSLVNAGEYQIVVTPAEGADAVNSKTATFHVLPLDITEDAEAAVSADADRAYTGSAVEPALVVTMDGTALVAGTDYSVEYSNNIEIGTAKAVVTGAGNFEGEKTVEFDITVRAFSDNTKVAEIADQDYVNKAIEPAVAVTDHDTALVADKDYTVSYENNIAAGEATVTVTGKGNYSGTVKQTFKIVVSKADQEAIDAFKATVNALPAADKVVASDEKAVKDARAAYEALTDIQKSLVGDSNDNLAEIEKAVAKIVADKEAADKVKAAIDALPAADEAKSSDKADVDAAKAAYDALTDDQKALIDQSDLDKLDAVEKAIADEAAADEVSKLIDALPAADAVKSSDKAAIDAARSAYDKLTDDQKALIDSVALSRLAAAEKAVAKVIDDEAPLAKGKTFTVETAAGTFTYKVTGDKTVTLTKVSKTKKKSVKVNDVKHKSVTYKVTAIAAKAFKSAKVKKVTVGDNVTKIGARAFQNAKQLKSVTIGKNVKKVGASAFKGAKKLKKVTVKSKKLTSKKSMKNFLKGSKVKTVKLSKLGKKKAKVKKAVKKYSGKKSLNIK